MLKIRRDNLDGYNKFINDICLYYSKNEDTKRKIPLIKDTFKRIVEQELSMRERKKIIQIRSFTNSANLNINFAHKNLWCTQNNEKSMYFEDNEKNLIVGTICPGWRHGWKKICKDEFIADQIDAFFHLSTQYIIRSFQINLIVAIVILYNHVCDFRWGPLLEIPLSNFNNVFTGFEKSIPKNISARSLKLKHYLNIINSLDPYINRANYYFVKSIDLYKNNYYEEAITNLDNTVDVMTQFIKARKGTPTQRRDIAIVQLSDELDMHGNIPIQLNRLYLLRCRFSSHPAQSKWWDFSEIYQEDIDSLFEAVKYTLIKLFQYETRNRLINPQPEKWSDWFYEHADVLFDAVWFHKIP